MQLSRKILVCSQSHAEETDQAAASIIDVCFFLYINRTIMCEGLETQKHWIWIYHNLKGDISTKIYVLYVELK